MAMQAARTYHLAEAGVTIDMGQRTAPVPQALIFDKNPLFCEVLSRQLTRPGVFDCAGCSDASALIDMIASRVPDLLILDPEHLGLTLAHDIVAFGREVASASPKTRLISYSFADTSRIMGAALDAGFRGCLSKSVNLDRLEAAMNAVLSGGLFFDEASLPHLVPLFGARGETGDVLSEREQEVLVLIARGQGTKQIAYDLNISIKTVDTYKARAVQKLGLKNRADLVEYAIQKGWMA